MWVKCESNTTKRFIETYFCFHWIGLKFEIKREDKMIELFNSRRMILVVVILIMVCIIIIIFEDLLADNVDKPSPLRPIENNTSKSNVNLIQTLNNSLNSSQFNEIKGENIKTESKCWRYETYEVLSDCESCLPDIGSQHLIACKANGFRQRINCKTIGLVYRSCDTSEHHFWIFQFIMFSISIISAFYVNQRQRYLNRKTIERIERQIAS